MLGKTLSELSVLSICMINTEKTVVGFMSLSDHPNLPSVDASSWDLWVRNKFQRYWLPRNTLFIHYMACSEEIAEDFMCEAYTAIFMNDMYLQNILLLVLPSNLRSFESYFRTTTARRRITLHRPAHVDIDELPYTHIVLDAYRTDFCPKLKVRRAVEEDNDDVIELLKDCPALKEMYGNYYVSEVIARHPDIPRTILVAESPKERNHVVGVMGINTEINYSKLQSIYELQPHHGLVKASPENKREMKQANKLLRCFGDPIMRGQFGPYDPPPEPVPEPPEKLNSTAMERRKTIQKIRSNLLSETSCVALPSTCNIMHMSACFQHMIYANRQSEELSDKITLTNSMSWLTDDLEGDSFDYDIVNITDDLLRIPEQISLLDVNYSKTELRHPSEPQHMKSSKRETTKTTKKAEADGVEITGLPNAFMIELYALDKSVDQRHAFDMLEAAFEVMVQKDYCLLRMPTSCQAFPLLEHFCFVPTKVNKCCDYSLYVAHRNSVFGKLRVRPAEFADIPQIALLLHDLDGSESIWTVEQSIRHRRKHEAYVFYSGLTLVGFGVLEPTEQLDLIRIKFSLESFYNHKYHRGLGAKHGFASIKTTQVYPVFEQHYRFFARDMMRQSGSQALLWMTTYRNKIIVQKTNCLASAMIPLIPRLTEIDYSCIPLMKKRLISSQGLTIFTAWFLNKKMTSVRKVNVDMRIVIVGASRTALGFLESLVFSDASAYMMFTNVTLISPNGLPYMRQSTEAASKMLLCNHSTSERRLKSTPYTFYVNILQGTMADINRQMKYVTLTSGGRYYYDRLFLMIGKQYQLPEYLVFQEQYLTDAAAKAAKEEKKDSKRPSYLCFDNPHRPAIDLKLVPCDAPYNVFTVNDVHSALKALNYVKMLGYIAPECKIVVYGATLEAYSTINALVEAKVHPKKIILVEPFPTDSKYIARIPVFYNSYVDQTVIKMLESLKIQVHRGYYFESWNLDYQRNIVTHLDIVSHYKQLRINCAALFYYGNRGLDANAFTAVQKSGTVYLGGILVDHEYRTRDPCVYAAGRATRHTRELSDQHRHKYHDSFEIGCVLGKQIRDELDPLFEHLDNEPHRSKFAAPVRIPSYIDLSEKNNNSKSKLARIPHLRKPIVIQCALPGRLNFLDVRSPGQKVPHHFLQSMHYNGHVLETFKNGYFKLHLNRDLIVDGITCLTRHDVIVENYKLLFGLSATVLNNVHIRYNTQKIDNFYEYFSEPWAQFLYYDRRDELFATVKELLPLDMNETIREALTDLANELEKKMDKRDSMSTILRTNFGKSPHVSVITDFVVEWLSNHDLLLPMYLQPQEVIDFKDDINRFFKKKKRTVTVMLNIEPDH